jgi:CARDB
MPPTGPSTDRQTLMVRRLVAAGVGIVVLLLLVFGLRSCLNSRKDTAYRDYVREVSDLIRESDQESANLFRVLSGPDNASDVQVENQLNTFSGQAGQLVERAAQLNHPGELDGAQQFLEETFKFRRDGVAAIARQLPAAIAQQGDQKQGTQQIAASMQNFLTSDVIYQTRVTPGLRSAFDAQGLGAEEIPRSRFLPNPDWVVPSTVADRIGKLGGGASDKAATPGLHGTGIASATLGGQALTPGGSANIAVTKDLKLVVQVANQGENTETDVKVSVTIGRGGDQIKAEKTLDTIAAGETKPVEIPITDQPPTGQNVPVEVNIAKVSGEQKLDNNKATYSAIFTR